eukprot:PhF_6_TR14174/c1_g1_i1/m.22689
MVNLRSMELFPSHLPVVQRWRKTLFYVMWAVWIITLADLVIALTTAPITVTRLLQKSSNIFQVVFLPIGLIPGMKSQQINDLHFTIVMQIINIANTLGSLHVMPTRPVVVQAVVSMIFITVTNLPWWKLQCMTLVPGIMISLYNATFGINGYSMILIVEPEEGLSRELVVQARLLFVPIILAMIHRLRLQYAEAMEKLEGAVSVAK